MNAWWPAAPARRIADKLRHLSLRQRFLVAPLLGLLLLGALLAAFLHESQRQNQLLTQVTEQRLAAFDHYANVFMGLSEQQMALYELLIGAARLDDATIHTRAKTHLNAIHEAIATIKGFYASELIKRDKAADFEAQHRHLLRLLEDYRQTVSYAVEMATVQPRLAPTHVAPINQRFAATSRSFSQLLDLQRRGFAAQIATEVSRTHTTTGIFAVAGLSGAGLLLFLSLALSRFLSGTLEAQIDTLSQLADQAAPGQENDDAVRRIGHAIESFRQTQIWLRDSELRFRSFFQRNHAVMLLIEPESGTIVDANESAAEFYGYTRQQLAKMTIQEIDIPPSAQTAAEQQATRPAERKDFSFLHRLADGRQRDVEIHATPIETGGKTFLFSIIHDITERKQAEASLQNSRQLTQSILDHSGAIVFVKDMAGRYLLINRLFEERFDVTLEFLLGKSDYDFLPAATADALRAADRQALTARAAVEFEEVVPQSDGLHTYISTKCPLYDSSGQPYAVCGIATDITERKQAETALRLSEAALNEAQAIAKVGSWSLDLHTDMLTWSAETYRIFGQSPDTPLTLANFHLRIHPADRDVVRAAWDAALHGQPYDIEHRIDVGGEVRWVRECAHIRFDSNGMPCFGIGTAQDITELRRAQEALSDLNRDLERRVAERTVQLEAASRAKSDFLANMSHEIRTPMNTMLGMAYLLQKTALTAKQRDYVEKIHASGQHLLGLIDAILDLSKIEAGKLDLEVVDFEFAAVMQNLGNLCAPQIEAKGLRLTFDLDPAIPHRLRGDPLRLAQVLINYTNNAVKFTERGGITVRASVAEEREEDCCQLHFEVQDTGIGMTDDEQGKLFQLFQQGDTSTTRKYGGTGLGLAISKQLAALMGGTVGMASQCGQGSRFWFTVRLGISTAEPLAASECDRSTHPDTAIAGTHILLADDHPLNQQVACDLLELTGATVCIANNGQEVIDLLQREHFDCVLMDVQMPEMDGLEATRRIRATAATAAMPVIAMTANAWNQDREHCLAAGVNDFISKPIQPEIFYATIARWLAQSCSEQPQLVASGAVAVVSDNNAGMFGGDPNIIDLAVPAKTLKNDPAKIGRVTRKFIKATWSDIPKIEAALECGDTATLGALGHRIRSPAQALGATGLADLCQTLEALREGGDVAQAATVVPQLRVLLEQIVQQVENHPLLASN